MAFMQTESVLQTKKSVWTDKITVFCSPAADILKKVLLKCFWSSPLPTIWILSKLLILIGSLHNKKAKFLKKNIKKSSPQKP